MKKTRQIYQQLQIDRVGAAAWVFGAIQFFICQLLVGFAWPTPYSWSLNNVSDLGNVYCQPWGDNARYVCSPLHDLMNASFIIQGLLILTGVILLKALWGPGCLGRIARSLLAIAGLAIAIAGFSPADVNENVHVVLGAFPLAFLGNVGLILVGPALGTSISKGIRIVGPALGSIGLIATWLFFGGNYLGLGMGGMERVAMLNVPNWTLIIGCYILLKRKANNHNASPS